MRTSWRKGLILGIILLFVGTSFSISRQTITLPPEIIIGPYTQNVTDTSITIVWETNIQTFNNKVEYGETERYGYEKSGDPGVTHHEVMITSGFKSGHYKVVSDTVESNDYKFELIPLDPESFKFVVFGDSRSDRVKRRMVSNQVNNETSDFVIHSGDMVANGNDWSDWEDWLNDSMPLLQNTTMFGVRGNHEGNGDYYRRVFTPPNDTNCWYSFDYGDCHFIVLDDNVNYGKGSSQYQWLEDDLASTDKHFKTAIQHEGMYCAGGHDSNVKLRNALEPLFNRYGVQVVFSGHNHFYQRSEELNGTVYITSAGAGAPLYSPEDAWFVNNSKKAYHYCLVSVSSVTEKMVISARYGVNGTAFDEYVVSLPVGVNTHIIKPEKALYIFNKKIMPLSSALIIGKIDIEVVATSYQYEIDKVEFYIDDELKYTDYEWQYKWLWEERAVGAHTIKIIAQDTANNTATDEQEVWIFNL